MGKEMGKDSTRIIYQYNLSTCLVFCIQTNTGRGFSINGTENNEKTNEESIKKITG